MCKNKKERKNNKRTIIKNKRLCKEYPFLIPRNRWTGKIVDNYDYSYTEFDDVPKGWRKIVSKLHKNIKPYLIKANYLDKFRILQIKEKYGSLRYYTGGIPTSVANEINDLINKAERESEHTCIVCGKPAKMCCYQGWYSPYCKKCLESIYNNQEEWIRKHKDNYYSEYEFNYEDFVCEESEDEI